MANYTKRDQRAADVGKMIAEAKAPAKRAKATPGAPATLGQAIRSSRKWIWLLCARCDRRVPRALAPYAIRFGEGVTVVDLARIATCSSCGKVGALMQLPSLIGIGEDLIAEPFPAELATRGLERWISRVTRTRLPAPVRAARARALPTWRAWGKACFPPFLR